MMLWSASCLIRFGICQRFALAEKIGIAFTFAVLLVCSIWNAISYQQLIAEGQIQSNSPISFSTLIAGCLSVFIYEVLREMPEMGRNTIRLCQSTIAVSCVLSGLLFPVAQMACFGMTDYRRNVDVIVVFGAKVHEDGQLSSILEERVLTGCELYHQGLAPQILFSGGPGVGDIHETQGMRRRALELGVPAAAISIDLNGVDTESTVLHSTIVLTRLFDSLHFEWIQIECWISCESVGCGMVSRLDEGDLEWRCSINSSVKTS